MDRKSTLVAGGVALLAFVAFVLALVGIAAARKAQRGSGSSSSGSSSSGFSNGFVQQCTAVAARYADVPTAMNSLMPTLARAQWLSTGGAYAPPAAALPTWVTHMADGSPMPPALMCQLIDGCTAGQWDQATADGTCYATTPSQGGWARCSGPDAAAAAAASMNQRFMCKT